MMLSAPALPKAIPRGSPPTDYQHNPYAPVWGAMHWGHAVSEDMVHWKHLPIALGPNEPCDDHPKGGVFSGSAVDCGGRLAVLYAGTTNHGSGFVQSQCLPVSADDGLPFEKYAGNPVIGAPPEGISADFRDPRVLRHGNWWYMVLGASIGAGAKAGGEGGALLYRSADLRQWEYRGIAARSSGEWGSMWECPGLFELDGKWVLTFSPMFCGERKAVYWVGDMDFEAGRYERTSDGELDWGFDYYAAQSMRCPGGRTVLMAWMNGWDWMPWWRDFGPTAPEGWCGCMALPRSVSLNGQGKLRLWPGAEVEVLYDQQETQTDLTVGHAPVPLACPDSVCFALELVIDEGHGDAQKLHVVLQASQGKRTDYARCTLTFDRSDADDGCSQGIRCQKIQDARKLLIYSDTSSIELFADGGEVCMSFTIYPTHGERGLMLTSEGGVSRIVSANLPSIKPAGGSAHGL